MAQYSEPPPFTFTATAFDIGTAGTLFTIPQMSSYESVPTDTVSAAAVPTTTAVAATELVSFPDLQRCRCQCCEGCDEPRIVCVYVVLVTEHTEREHV